MIRLLIARRVLILTIIQIFRFIPISNKDILHQLPIPIRTSLHTSISHILHTYRSLTKWPRKTTITTYKRRDDQNQISKSDSNRTQTEPPTIHNSETTNRTRQPSHIDSTPTTRTNAGVHIRQHTRKS